MEEKLLKINIPNNIPISSYLDRKSELISLYDPNSYGSSSLYDSNQSITSSNKDEDKDEDKEDDKDEDKEDENKDDKKYNDIISSSYKSRLSFYSTRSSLPSITNKINDTNKSNDIYERQKYIEFMIKQNTYLNNAKYQKIFNQIIFNFKL